jgi:DNA (cytosine-5)-methyltransferase 1
MVTKKVGSLFSGIGGMDLGLQRVGMEIAWQVEIDEFCNKVLEKHWPDVKRYGDIKNVKGTELGTVNVICGGFPCQPFSNAGKRRGKEDDRYLWPEMLRVVSEVRSDWVIGENVGGFINMGLDNCISDLENQGYEVQAFIIPACAVNAPHRRDRVWIVANSTSTRLQTIQFRHGNSLEILQKTSSNFE